MPENADFNALHKAAFRTAFEYLQENWPPVNSKDFFLVSASKANKAYNESDGNKLARKLILAVMEYLFDQAESGESV